MIMKDSDNMNKKVLVIGSLNMDYSISVDKLPSPGETVLGSDFLLVPGGKGANQAYGLGKLGANVSMIGAVGDDDNGRLLLENLKSVNVNIDGIEVISGEKTGCAFVNVDSNSENNIIVIGGANLKVDKHIIDKNISKVKEADIIVMQLEIPIDTIKYVLELTKEDNKIIIIDPAPAKKNIDKDIFNNVDFIKPNITELEILSGMKINNDIDVVQAANKMLELGVKNVIVTLGENGSILVSKDKNKKFETLKVNAVDSTAAGDSFVAGLALSLSENKPLENSIKYAHIVSSYSVTKKGAQSSIPSKEDLNEFISVLKKETLEKIIIDADPGVDDAFAILLACKSNEFDIDGITTVCGNTNIENIINNTFKLLDLCDRNDIKVYKGMDLSVSNILEDASHVHGKNGMGGIEFDKINRNVEEINAVDYLISRVNSNPGEFTICTLGPLTNISEAIKKDKDFKNNIKKLVIMGGADGIGNITPFVEFNFYKDPISAKYVFDNLNCEIVVVPLNASYQFPLLLEYEEKLKNKNNEISKFCYDITRESSDYDRNVEKLGGLILNDPLTILYLLDNSLFGYEYVNINIITEGEKSGMSEVVKCDKSNIKFIYNIEYSKCYKILFKRLFDIEL